MSLINYNILTSLEKILAEYGIEGVLVIGALFTLIYMIKNVWVGNFLKKISTYLIDKLLKKNKTPVIENLNESNIIQHDIFNYIDFWINAKIPTLEFSTSYRTKIFRLYLEIYLKAYKNNLEKFIEEKKYENLQDLKLLAIILKLINDIIVSYETECKLEEIPDIVINKMKYKNNDAISLTLDLIENICSSKFYDSKNNLLRIYSILNIILSVLENTVTNSEKICNSINGELNEIKN